jgi:hypothetical protein
VSDLWRVAETGGPSSPMFASTGSTSTSFPSPLPGGRGFLYRACVDNGTTCEERVYDGRQRESRPLPRVPTSSIIQYCACGQLLYVQSGVLMAVPFDLRKLDVSGPAVAVADSVSDFSVSRTGTLVMRRGAGQTAPNQQLVWVDRLGRIVPADTSFTFRQPASTNAGWSLSPDGTELALGANGDEGDDIWVKPLPHGPPSRITYDPAFDFRPHWEGPGSVLFTSLRTPNGVYERRADGAGSDSALVTVPAVPAEGVITGDWLLVRIGSLAGPGGRDILGMRPGVDSALRPVIATPYDEDAISPSPDGRWLAYQSDETGRTEVFVRSFPDVDRVKRQVSNGGGVAPLWSRDGRELFYLSATHDMMSVGFTGSTSPVLGDPVRLFHVPDDLLSVETAYYTPWDVARDGRFIMARVVSPAKTLAASIVVVENGLQALKGGRQR